MAQWKGKGDILKSQRDINHISPKNTKGKISDVSSDTNKNIVQNNKNTSALAVDFVSKTFGKISLREIRDPDYTTEDIKNFFTSFDFADRVDLYVDDKYRPYVDDGSILTVTLNYKKFDLPAHLMWICLSDDVKANFLQIKSHFKRFHGLFSAYNRKMIIKSFDK